ncbi:hypothetical protein ACFLZK_01210 [Patescibacteria group bacterium]
MYISEALVSLLENDLSWVKTLNTSFDGMLVKHHLDQLLAHEPEKVVVDKAIQALKMYRHDGRQCFSNEDRPELVILLEEILELIKNK